VPGGPIRLGNRTLGRLPGGAGPRALPAGVAYELADMLREVVRSGTARKASSPDYDRAGKTGTTNDFVDAWFVGFTSRYTIAVWIGSDTTQSLGDKETGGKTALPAWIRIAEALPYEKGERMPIPDEAVLMPWGGTWVGLPRGQVPADLLAVPPVDPQRPLGLAAEPRRRR
jgi:membrane carboxypeptidase/penicillin-binding protein